MQKTILFLLLLGFSTGILAVDPLGFFPGPVVESLKRIAQQHGVPGDLQSIEYTGQKEYANGNYLRHAVLLFEGGTRMAIRVRLSSDEAMLGFDSLRVYPGH